MGDERCAILLGPHLAVTGPRKGSMMATTTPTDPMGLAAGEALEDWTGDADYHEYTKAADPVGSGRIAAVPVERFPAALHATGATRVVPLDLSERLDTPWPATAPGLLAAFVCIPAGEELALQTTATSELLFVLSGSGHTTLATGTIAWGRGDFLAVPVGTHARHRAADDAVLYRVDDSPLLAYLGATATEARFAPTHYPAQTVREHLEAARVAPDAADRSRIAILLANQRLPQTLTVTHTLWAMFGVLPAGRMQRPHRHQSVALDLIVEAGPGCYTLVGTEIDPETRSIVNPVRVDWEPGGAFVTPPGFWHSHHNTNDTDAYLVPVQDAGLHTHLRTLDIRFS